MLGLLSSCVSGVLTCQALSLVVKEHQKYFQSILRVSFLTPLKSCFCRLKVCACERVPKVSQFPFEGTELDGSNYRSWTSKVLISYLIKR